LKTGDILKYVLIAAGAYLVYTYLRQNGYLDSVFGPVTGVVPAPGQGVTPGQQLIAAPAPGVKIGTETPAGAGTAPVKSVVTVVGRETRGEPVGAGPESTTAAIARLSQNDAFIYGPAADANSEGNGRAGYYRWAFYYNQTEAGKTTPVPDPGSLGIDPSAPMTLDEWWALVSQYGLSGVGAGHYGYPSLWSGRMGVA